uniref:C2H2-type domain-containing protein n=1 Tax=Magallana gigas TaxID=29159 RepID=K1PT72_MAGGI
MSCLTVESPGYPDVSFATHTCITSTLEMEKQNENMHETQDEISSENPSTSKLFCCDVCGKDFILKSYLQVHMKMHKEERPYKCEVCHKAFKQMAALARHNRIHTDTSEHIQGKDHLFVRYVGKHLWKISIYVDMCCECTQKSVHMSVRLVGLGLQRRGL